MSDYDKFDERVSEIENKVYELAEGQSAIKAMLKNGIKDNLVNVNRKIDAINESKAEDKQMLVRIEQKLTDHIEADNKKTSSGRFGLSTTISILAVLVAIGAVIVGAVV
jgi:hypothetical protein